MGIIFNPDQETYARSNRGAGRGGLLGWFMKLTGATDEQSANVGLLVFAILFFIAAVAVFFLYG